MHIKNLFLPLILFFLVSLFLNCCSSDKDQDDPPEEPKTDYAQMAVTGMNNLIKNFWVSGEGIRPTWGGIHVPEEYQDKRGQLWERGMMIFPMYHLYQFNNDPDLHSKLLFEAERLKNKYEESILTQAGHYYNTALDDCAWNAMMYMMFYDLTGDTWYVNVAKSLINSSIIRWTDPADGALYYSDSKTIKSLYTAGLVLAMLEIYDVTGEQEWLDKAIFHYGWMISLLERSDGLYWTDADSSGPLGKEDPSRINEASSVTFLAGNQAMCIISKRLYDIKKDETYLTRIKKTTLALATVYNKNGIYLNDRDAWTNGAFMSDFAKFIAANPELVYTNADLLMATARSIVAKDVTADGYYGGSWQGPTGKGSKWTDGGAVPEQIMTSGSTVHVLVAAAILNQLKNATTIHDK